MRISEHYSLGLDQPSLDFVDVRLDTDVPLFVDPTALHLLDTEWGARCRSLIHNYFNLVLEHTVNNEPSEAEALLSSLSEPNETHLGLSKRRSRGHGMGSGLAEKMREALSSSEALESGLITDLEDTALMIDGIASDVISDIVTNIIREPLLEYTIQMCKQHDIPLEMRRTRKLWNPHTQKWERKDMLQPIVNSRRLMLVPKAIVRKSISYDAGQYYGKYLLEQLQEEDMANGLVRILKNGEQRPPTKESIKARLSVGKEGRINQKEQNRNLTPQRLETLAQYKEETEGNPKPALSHNEIAQKIETPAPNWDKLLSDMLAINPGRDEAKKYEKTVQALFDALFYPWLMFPIAQTRLNNGRKIVDITYTNVAQDDFFQWVKSIYPAGYIFVECKNYSADVGNPELDQLAGRFSPSRGKVGLLISRKIENRNAVTASCRDTANDQRGFILALDDDDIKALVETVKNQPADKRLQLLRDRFNQLVL